MPSKRFTVNWLDVQNILRNALIFLAPVLILVLEALRQGRGWDEIVVIFQLWGMNVALDFLRKFASRGK